MKTYTFPYSIKTTDIAPGNLLERLSNITGYESFTTGNRVVENGRLVLVDGKPKTTDSWIKVTGTDELDETDVKEVVDAFVVDFPDYENSKIAEYEAQKYARNRASAYDSVGNQLDMLMKDMRDGTTTHKDACEAVKAKFPKPE